MAPASLTFHAPLPTPSRTHLGRTRKRRPLLARIIMAVRTALEKHREREIERYITANGGLTDSVERELSRRFGGF